MTGAGWRISRLPRRSVRRNLEMRTMQRAYCKSIA
jgi:hypothetical protein